MQDTPNSQSAVLLSAAYFDLFEGDYEQAIQKYATIGATRDRKGISLNNEACCLLLSGHVGEGMALLEKTLLTSGRENAFQSIYKNLADFLYSWLDADLKLNKLKMYASDHFRESFKL